MIKARYTIHNLFATFLTATVCVFILASVSAADPLAVGTFASKIILSGEEGGKIDGDLWTSEAITKINKIVTLFYVDPASKKLNEPLEEAYKTEHFPPDKHASIAVINMAAAWYPNSMIESELRKKQEKFPRTIYVKDMKKTLVKEWGLEDHSVNVVIFNKDGKILYVKKGPVADSEIPALMALIRSNL